MKNAPSGMAVPLVADMAGGDKAYGTAATLINTVLCLVTIPLVMQIIAFL